MKVLLLAAACAAILSGQVDTGAVSGLIRDKTGAVIPAAKVRIAEQATGTETLAESNEAGLYTALALRPGQYVVTVEKEGFRLTKSKPFELRVQDRAEVNFDLELGQTSSEITVSATAPLLESETSSLGQVIEQKTIVDLPLNGRNYIQLATLGAGTLPSTRTAERDNFISNGARAVQNSYLLDGIDNKNRIVGFDKSSAQIIQPIVDAIQEFKVQTSTFSAEFGQAAGGVVNVSMRSGTNQFHGNVFEFLRNSALDATPYFQPAGVPKPAFIQNQFGATFGGPIIRNRTFFFGSWQSSREVNAAPQTTTVPLPSQLAGVFSKATDPLTGKPFPNGTIPTSRWDLVGAKLVAIFPLPNLPGTTSNYSYNPKERVQSDNYNVRVDHHFAKDFLFARVSQGWGTNVLPSALPDPAQQTGHVNLTQRQIVVSESHPFTPTLLNEARVGFVYTLNSQDVDSPRLFDQFGIKGALNEPKIKGLPLFNITGFAGLGTQGPGSTPISASGSGNFPSTKSGKLWQIVDSLSWVKGRHTLKTGIDFERATQYVYATNSARPTYTFNGSYTGTGNGLGDLMLGYVYTATTSQQQLDTIIQHIYNAFVQDDWKVSNKLTLNFGVRYELPEPYVEAHDRQANLILTSGSCYLQLITVANRGQCGLPRALVHADTNNFAPRFGFAYQLDAKTVVRGGSGFFYGRDENIGIQRRLPANPPYVTAASFSGAGQNTPAFFLQTGFPANALSLASGSTTINAFATEFPIGYVEQWNFNVQRELPHSFVAQIGYTGSEAHKLAVVNNYNQAYPGTGALNNRRPVQGFGDIMYYAPLNNSTYNALISKLERRFANGLSLLAAYTYGHSIDGGPANNDQNDPAATDAHNLKGNKGSSNFDIKHRFVVSGFYQLPFGKSKGFANLLVRDWELSAIFSKQTGQPLTVTQSTDPSGSSTSARPNRIMDGNLPSDQQTRTHWFDTSAFVPVTCICFGNSGRGIIRGPGVTQLDVSLIRDFHYQERYRLQFRAESFNLTNHPNLGLPNTSIGNQSVGIITSIVGNERQNQLALKLYF